MYGGTLKRTNLGCTPFFFSLHLFFFWYYSKRYTIWAIVLSLGRVCLAPHRFRYNWESLMAIRSLARVFNVSMTLFMQSSGSHGSAFAIEIVHCCVCPHSPCGLRHFSTTRDVRNWKRGYHPRGRRVEKRKSGHPSDPFRGDAMRCQKQSDGKDFFATATPRRFFVAFSMDTEIHLDPTSFQHKRSALHSNPKA